MSEETIRRQDRGGRSGLPHVFPDGEETNGGWGLTPCPDHPDTAAVDCIICEPVDSEGAP